MTRSLISAIVAIAMLGLGALAQVPTPSASPQITTATCGKPVCTWIAYSNSYARATGQPQTVSNSFSVLNPNTQFTLHVDNNGVSSAIVSINGNQIFGPSDFKPNITTLDRPATLAINNTVEVQLLSKPGTSLTLAVIGVDNDPPSVIPTENPPPNTFGWQNQNVDITYVCADATSGIALCPRPTLLTTEGLNQLVSGTAFDLAGNSEAVTLAVSIDKNPPTIFPSQNPPPNSFGWNHTVVTVTFSCTDGLSGVASCPPPQTISSEGADQSIGGTAFDKAGNSATAAVNLNIDETPPVLNISSPVTGSTATSANLQLTGTVSDNLSGVALVTCNGATAALSVGTFSCTVSLLAGPNTIQVQATDRAGNLSRTQLSITFNAASPSPPPNSLLITPSLANMLIGESRSISLVGDIGQPVTGATWTVSDPTIVSITATDPPQLTALAQGTATLTATFNGLTASMTINVLPGTSLPVGTAIWSFDPLPGNRVHQIVPANPANPGDPDIYVREGANSLRGFTADGRQLWAIQVNLPLPGTQAAASAITTRSATTTAASTGLQTTSPAKTQPSPLLARIIAAHRQFLRDHGMPDPVDMLAQHSSLDRGSALIHAPPLAAQSTLVAPLNASSSGDLTGQTLINQTVPDNTGGSIQVLRTCLVSNCNTFVPGFVRIDNQTQQPTWSQQLLDGPYVGGIPAIAIAPDNTIYATGIFETGPPDSNGIAPTHSLIAGIDGETGALKFSIPVTPSNSHFTLLDTDGNTVDDQQQDSAAVVGPIAVLEDGALHALVFSQQFTEVDSQSGFSSNGSQRFCLFASTCPISFSDHKKLQLITVQPDGSSSLQGIDSADFDISGCQPNCSDPIELNFRLPGDVIPDGMGGTLAQWTFNREDTTAFRFNLDNKVRHIDSSGVVQDFDLPQLTPLNLGDVSAAAQSLVLGENNVAFGAGLHSLVGFNVTTGATLFTFQSAITEQPGLLAATADGGLLAALFNAQFGFPSGVDSLFLLNTSASATSATSLSGVSTLSLFDSNNVLAVIAAGLGGSMLVGQAAALDPNLAWGLPNAFLLPLRASPPPTIQVTRTSLTQTSSIGRPQPGNNPAFTYTANSGASYIPNDPNAHPNVANIQAPPNPGTAPIPGALAAFTATYHRSTRTASKIFHSAIFGLSCYVLASENDFLDANGNCTAITIGGTRFSGVTQNPTGLPAGNYCTAFLADVRLQGSGTSSNGTMVHWVSGTNPNWIFTVVNNFTGADGTALIPNGSVARDRSIVPRNTTVQLETGNFAANDSGGAIVGYRLDIFGGTGRAACANFSNVLSIGACHPGITTCPDLPIP